MTILVVPLALLVTLGLMCLFAYRDKKDKQKRNPPEQKYYSKSDKYVRLKEGETYLLRNVLFRFHKSAVPVRLESLTDVANDLSLTKGVAITLYCTLQGSSASKAFEMNVGVDYTHFDFEGKKYRISIEKSSNDFILEFVQDLK